MSDSFVDDTQNGLNDAHLLNPLSLDQLIRNLENMAQPGNGFYTAQVEA